MILPEYFIQLFVYNHWVNQLALKSAEMLSSEQFFQPQGHGWDSVQRTLVHIMNAEWIWLERWHGNSPGEWLPFDDFPTAEAIRVHWTGITREQRTFVENLTSKDLQQTLSYVNSSGVAYQAPLWLLLGHLVNHGTHHRAELSAIFTAFGIAHRENDMYYHYLIQSGQMDE